MIRDLKGWRRKAALELDVGIYVVKKGINAILFGMSFQKWKHLNGISNEKRSPSIEKVEREVAKARSLIVDREFRNGKASRKEKRHASSRVPLKERNGNLPKTSKQTLL